MFLANKYSRWYYSIIKNAKDRINTLYTEKHHILPKSLGGSNEKENLVSLTAREHFICHRLLTKFTYGKARSKMLRAVWKVSHRNDFQIDAGKEKLTSRQYEIARIANAEASSLYRHSDESKAKISAGNKGKPKSEEHKTNIGNSSRGRKWSEESKLNLSISNAGSKNGNAKKWKLSHDDGRIEFTGCLKSWCKEKNLPYCSLGHARNNNTTYEGWFLECLTPKKEKKGT